MEGTDIIYLDKIEYEKLLLNIEKLRAKIFQISQVSSNIDRDTILELRRQSYKLEEELKRELQKLSRVKLIDGRASKKITNVNDYVLVNLSFSEDDTIEMIIKLVANSNPNLSSEINEISIDSPLGRTIYRQKIGFVGKYTVQGNETMVKILKISKNFDDMNESLLRNSKTL